jgi:hypothetical protein
MLLRRDNAHIPSAALLGGSTLGEANTFNYSRIDLSSVTADFDSLAD